MNMRIATTIGLATLLSLSAPAFAQAGSAQTAPAGWQGETGFAQFAPQPDPVATRIDYTIWNDALKYFVLPMGRSIREGARRPDPSFGTRQVYGHDSRYRLEGNRVIFSFLSDEVIQSLTEYRQDLERTAETVDISKLRRNEQLAFWINLHNAAVIEQIALAYPVNSPSMMKVGPEALPLDEARFITIRGVKMSPRDIRTQIVYPNWSDPKVIYGFFRGEIGGPSIQRTAFDAENVGDLLDDSAAEFVNALRGTERWGDTLQVSRIYEEARPFYFGEWPGALRDHLLKYANDEVSRIIAETSKTEAVLYETDVADLAKGEREPSYSYVLSSVDANGGRPPSTRIPGSVQRLLSERQQKFDKLIRNRELVGRVYWQDIDLPGEDEQDDEVE